MYKTTHAYNIITLTQAISEISLGECTEAPLQFLKSRDQPLQVAEGKQNIASYLVWPVICRK